MACLLRRFFATRTLPTTVWLGSMWSVRICLLQRLLVLMDILGLNPVHRSELVVFLRAEGSLLKSAGLSPALQQLVCDMNEDTWFRRVSSG